MLLHLSTNHLSTANTEIIKMIQQVKEQFQINILQRKMNNKGLVEDHSTITETLKIIEALMLSLELKELNLNHKELPMILTDLKKDVQPQRLINGDPSMLTNEKESSAITKETTETTKSVSFQNNILPK